MGARAGKGFWVRPVLGSWRVALLTQSPLLPVAVLPLLPLSDGDQDWASPFLLQSLRTCQSPGRSLFVASGLEPAVLGVQVSAVTPWVAVLCSYLLFVPPAFKVTNLCT